MPVDPPSPWTPAIRTLLLCDLWPDCADEVPYDFRRACEQLRDLPKERFGG